MAKLLEQALEAGYYGDTLPIDDSVERRISCAFGKVSP